MPEIHTSKNTAPDGESSKKPITIDHPTPDGEPPSTEDLGAAPEEGASGERLGRISAELGRLAAGRRFYEPGPGDGQSLGQQPVDQREKLRARLRAAGKLNPITESESSTNEAASDTSKHGAAETGRSDPRPRPQTREEVLAALRGEHPSPAAREDSPDGDSSVADTESASVAPENQDELGNSDEQDPNESPEVLDKQSPSVSEALKRLAEADTTQSAIRNMAGAAEDLAKLNTADTLRAPVLFGRIQEFTSGILVMLNRFNGAVEEVGGDLAQDEAARLSNAIDQVRRYLAVMNNVAEQGFSRRISDEEYSQHALQLNNSITELQRFMNVSVKRQENEEQG